MCFSTSQAVIRGNSLQLDNSSFLSYTQVRSTGSWRTDRYMCQLSAVISGLRSLKRDRDSEPRVAKLCWCCCVELVPSKAKVSHYGTVRCQNEWLYPALNSRTIYCAKDLASRPKPVHVLDEHTGLRINLHMEYHYDHYCLTTSRLPSSMLHTNSQERSMGLDFRLAT